MTGPWRNTDPARPGRPSVPLPPARMPMWRGGRPLKRWTWVGAFGPDAMLCAAVARVGPLVSSWWAVWDGSSLTDDTLRRRGGLVVEPSRVVELLAARITNRDLGIPANPRIEMVESRWIENRSLRGSRVVNS